MKKFLIVPVIVALVCTFSACGDKTSESSSLSSESSITSSESSQINDTITTTDESGIEQVTESKTTEEVTTKQTTTEKTTVTTEITTITTSAPVTTESVIENKDNGGIVFDTPVEEQSDDDLISAGQELFNSACETEWNYTVGSPYELDMNQTAPNQFGWDCYLVTTEGINSLADVRSDYHKVFSENYTDTLDEVFTEANGHVYCLNGLRGSNIFYIESVVTSLNERSESEISFTVTNYFSGDDYNNEAYTVEEDFVISIDSDGAWRVSKFRLPY